MVFFFEGAVMVLKTFRIPPEADGMKVLSFIRQFLPDLPESSIRKVFASKDVKLDNRRVPKDTPVCAGQQLTVFLPEAESRTSSLRIVYEDEDVLLVNKPSGISVENDAPGTLSLKELCRHYMQAGNPDMFAPVPCHRLDIRTSGLCLFAKNESSLLILQDAFRNRTVDKYYICLVRGIPKPPDAVCSAWLLKDPEKGKVRILDRAVPGALTVATGYETLESGPVSRLRVHLLTGRTHQIRAHLASLGHPVLGDDLYGDRAFNRLQKARSLKLCAVSLTLNTQNRLPQLDGKTFEITPPF